MERITLLSIAIFLFASITKAQINKGSTFIGGQISGSTYKYESGSTQQKQNAFLISPAIGTAINQNLIAGIDLTYVHSKNDYSSNSSNEYNSFGGGFFLKTVYIYCSTLLLLFARSGRILS